MPISSARKAPPAPVEATLKAQAEGLGLMAWLGAVFLDHAARAATEMASFARDEARRDLEALGRLVTCRDPEAAARLQRTHLVTKLAASSDEAGKLARMTAETCEVTRKRMSDWRG
ncbi:Phasin protein [Rhodovulum sp. ES.010]|uniref:phasin family protein n=1 Tax=Rhodovulum sp. ES.010 TaxID=1882821 RepID=UPI00092AB900|nr:phasin family protein [Rhodovulum sp. ES.010]SIO05607.1 Phasin protein [Rhodovulum sp. ES.010]